MREAARGVELLLSASLLHRRCAHLDDDEPDAGILEASVSFHMVQNLSDSCRDSDLYCCCCNHVFYPEQIQKSQKIAHRFTAKLRLSQTDRYAG